MNKETLSRLDTIIDLLKDLKPKKYEYKYIIKWVETINGEEAYYRPAYHERQERIKKYIDDGYELIDEDRSDISGWRYKLKLKFRREKQ